MAFNAPSFSEVIRYTRERRAFDNARRITAYHRGRGAEFKPHVGLIGTAASDPKRAKAWKNHQWRKRSQRCYYCDVKLIRCNTQPLPPNAGTVDHKTPISRRGPDKASNYCMCCHACNQRKADRTEAEYRLVLSNPLSEVTLFVCEPVGLEQPFDRCVVLAPDPPELHAAPL